MQSINLHGHRVPAPGAVQPTPRMQEITQELSAIQGKSAAELTELKKSSILDQKSPAVAAAGKVLQEQSGAFAHIHCGRSARGTDYEERISSGTKTNRHLLPIHQGPVAILQEVIAWMDAGNGIADKKIVEGAIRECSMQLSKTTQELTALATERDQEKFRAGVHKYAEGLALQLKAFPKGDSFVLPVGGSASAMYLRFIGRGDGNFDLRLYTAQQKSEGLQEGQEDETDRQVKPMVVFSNIPAEAIFGPRAHMLDILVGTALADMPAPAKTILSFFQHIAEYRVDASKETKELIRSQRAKIDSQKALNALLLDLCPNHDHFKAITINTRLLTLIAQYQHFSNNSADRNQLRIAAENLMKSVQNSKFLSEKESKLLLATALDLRDRIDEMERIGHPDGVPVEPIVSSIANEAERALAVVDGFTPPAVAKPNELKAVLPPEIPRFSGRMEDLPQFLPQFRKAIDALCVIEVAPGVKGRLYAEAIIEELLFAIPVGQSWEAVPEAGRMQCINELGMLMQHYCQAITDTAPTPTRSKQHVAVMLFYAHLDCLARLCDKDGFLKGLPIDDIDFEIALTGDMFHQIKSPLILTRRTELFNYFESVKKGVPGADTFSILSWRDQGIVPEDWDLELCKRLLAKEEIRAKIPKASAEKWSGQSNDEALLAYLHTDLGVDRGMMLRVGYSLENISLPSVLATTAPHISRLKQASVAVRVLFSQKSEAARKKDPWIELGFGESGRSISEMRVAGSRFENKSNRYGGQSPAFSVQAVDKDVVKDLSGLKKSGLFAVKSQGADLGSRWVPENEAYSYLGMLKPADYQRKEWAEVPRWDIVSLMEPREVAPLNIIQWMHSHHTELSESKVIREQLNMMLFQPYHNQKRQEQVALFNLLKNNPQAVLPAIRAFISETLDTYYRLRPGRIPVMPMVLFALQLAAQVDRACSEIHNGQTAGLYDVASVAEILQHNSEEIFLKEAEVKALIACQMTHWFPCHDPAAVSNRALLEATALWVELGGMLSNSLLHRDSSDILGAARNQLFNEIVRRKGDSTFIAALAKRLNLTVSQERWKTLDPLLFEASDAEGNVWRLDLFRGRLFFNGKPTTTPTLRPEGKLWNYLFGNRKHEIKTTGEMSTFQDAAYGPMRCYNDGKNLQIERMIGDSWYCCLAPDSPEVKKLIPPALHAGHSFFIARNPKSPIRLYVCNLQSGALKYGLTDKGELVNLASGYVAVLEPKDKVFTQLAPSSECIAWRSPTDKSASRLTFPRLCTSDGSKVSFKKDAVTGNWIYEANPSYIVRDPQIQNLISHTGNYLVLQKKGILGMGGLRILLLEGDEVCSKAYSSEVTTSIKPQDPWTSPVAKTVCSYRVEHGQLIPDPTEDLFYLARLQFAGKDYTYAMESLRSVGEGETLSSKALELLHAIIQPTDNVPDRSPEAAAVRLRALWLVSRTDREGAKKLLGEAVEDRFDDYYEGLSRMPQNLALTPIEEGQLLEVWPDIKDRGRLNAVKLALGKIEERTTHILEWPSAGSGKNRFIWDEIPSRPPFDYNVLEAPPKAKPAGMDIMEFEAIHKAYAQNCKYIDACLITKGDAGKEPVLPIYGDDELSCHQFYHCYDLMKKADDAERRSLAYLLDNFTTHELSEDDKNTEFPSAIRLKILRSVYHNPKAAPALPQVGDRGNRDAWLAWLKEFQKALPEKPASERVAKTVVIPSKPNQAQGKSVRRTPTTPVKLTVAPRIEIDQGLKQFRTAYFDSEKAPAPKVMPPLKRQKIEERDRLYAKGIDKEFELQEAESKRAYDQQSAQIVYKLKVGASRQDCLDNLRHYLKSDELAKMEKLILELSKQRDVRQLARMAKQESRELKDPTLPELVKASLTGTEEAYRKLNPFLSSQDIQKLHNSIIELMLASTHMSQLKRVERAMTRCIESLDPVEADAEWKDAVDELMAQRHYGCLTIHEIMQNMSTIYFEYKTEMRVKEKQVGLINGIAKRIDIKSPEELRNIVFQLLMGGGKTSVILSALMDIIASTKGERRIPALILHPTQFDGVLGNLRAYQRERFGQEIITVDYTREDLDNIETLQKIKDNLNNALEQGHGIAMKSTMPRTFLLELREIGANFYRDKKPVEYQRAQLLGQILQIIRDKTIFLTDEVDLCLDIIQQLNFPRGEPQHLSKEEVDLVQQLFNFIQKEKLIDFSPGSAATPETVYEQKVLPRLLDFACEMQQVPEALRAGYKRFLTNSIDGRVEEELTTNFKAGGLSWDAFTRLFEKGWFFDHGPDIQLNFDEMFPEALPQAKEKQTQVEDWAYLRYMYMLLAIKGGKEGRRAAGMQGLMRFVISKVLPRMLSLEMDRHRGYVGNKTGKVVPFVGRKAAGRTQMANPYEATCAHMYCGLKLGMEEGSVQYLAEKWHEAAEQKAKHHQQGGYEGTKEAVDFLTLTGVPLFEAQQGKRCDEAHQNLAKDTSKMLAFQAALAQQHATFYNSFLSSEAYDLPELTSANVACSGTPWNLMTYSRFENPLLDLGTEGIILNELRRQGAGQKPHLIDPSKGVVKEFLNLIQTRKASALIDTGGTVEDCTGLEFAKAYLDHFKDDPNRNAVIFFHREKNREGFAVLKRGDDKKIPKKPTWLPDTKPETIKNNDVDMKKMFIYFEESKTTGIDFKLPVTALALLTFNPLFTTFRSMGQGATRMRHLFGGQRIEHVMAQTHLDFYGNEVPMVDDLISTSIATQGREKCKLSTRSVREKVGHTPRSLVQQNLIDLAAMNPTGLNDFSTKFGEYLDDFSEPDLFSQFCRVTRLVDALPKLKELRQEELAKAAKVDPEFAAALEKPFAKLEKTTEELDAAGLIADKVESPDNAQTLDKQLEIALEQEDEQERVNEQEVDLDTETVQTLRDYERHWDLTSEKQKTWKDLNTLNGELPGQKQGVKTVKLIDHLRTIKDQISIDAFPKDLPLYCSENFITGVGKNTLKVLHPGHKLISHLLICLGEDKQPKVMILTQEELKQFSEGLANRKDQKYWIVNLRGSSVCGGDLPPSLRKNREFKRTVWFANMFNCNLDYLLSVPKLTEAMMREAGAVRRKFLQIRIFMAPQNREILRALSDGSYNAKEVPSFMRDKGKVTVRDKMMQIMKSGPMTLLLTSECLNPSENE